MNATCMLSYSHLCLFPCLDDSRLLESPIIFKKKQQKTVITSTMYVQYVFDLHECIVFFSSCDTSQGTSLERCSSYTVYLRMDLIFTSTKFKMFLTQDCEQ